MAITPKEFIKNMGAGYNLGNMYDCYNFTKATEFWRYWQYGTFSYKIENVTENKAFTVVKGGKQVETTMSFTFPSSGSANIIISHNEYSISKHMKFVIKSAKVGGSIVAPTKSNFTTTTSGNNQSFTISASDLSSTASGKTVDIVFYVDIDSLEQHPTNDSAILSKARKFYATAPIDSWGNRRLKEAHLLAIWAVGFRSIRLPITWSGRCDVGENGHVTIDEEFFEHLDSIINMIHTTSHPFNVFINVHHDDGEAGWLHTDTYVDDAEVRTRYADYWTQIANHFKNYDYWLTFGSNNEILNKNLVWEGASVTKKDIYGLVQLQQKAHDIIRASGGKNADRIVLYPTYAAKRGAMGSEYENPSDSSDKGTWHIPYGSNGQIDPYGICEIHPYNAGINNVIQDNQKAYSYGIPVIYGEYGVSSSQLNDKATCISQAFMVSYAKYHGMGTYLWDDFGNMKILNKDECTLTNYNDFNKLWVGYAHNFAPSLTKSADLKKVNVKLSNRSNIMCLGDKTTIELDSNEDITLVQEVGLSVTIKGNELTTGGIGTSSILVMSYIGEYNTIDIDVVDYNNKVETVYNSGWESNTYSEWDSWKETNNASVASLFIPVSGGDTIKFVNTSNSNPLRVREYTANKSLILWGDKAYSITSGTEHSVQANCAYVGVYFTRSSSNGVYQEPKQDTKVIVYSRDFSVPETGFEVEDRTSSIADYTKYKGSVYRDINIIGGVSYKIDCGMPCEIQLIGYNHDGDIRESVWLNNGDVYNADLFVEKVRIILYFDKTPEKVADLFYAKTIKPLLSYEDYVSNTPLSYKETCPPKPNNDSGSSGGEGNPITYLGTIIKHNGKFVL